MAHLDAVHAAVDSSSRSRFIPRLVQRSLDASMPAMLRAYADASIAKSAHAATDTAIATMTYRGTVKRDRMPALAAWLRSRAQPVVQAGKR